MADLGSTKVFGDLTVAGDIRIGGASIIDTINAGDNTAVKLTGDQTIAGVKAFSSNIVGNITGNVTGNAGTASTATKLQTARTISLSGDSTGSVTFDGSANANIVVTRSTANMLSDILAVDGAGSGIDADLLDGQHGSYYGTAAAVALNTAKVSNVSTNLSYTTAATTGTVVSSDGTNATIPAATTSLAGLMTNVDKTKLDGIAAGAQVNVATNLSVTAGTTAGPIVTSSTGTNATLPTASASASGVVTTGNQTWAGVKTFTSSPIVPTPTTDTQATNKQYVDGKYSGFKNYIINGNFDIWQRGISQTINGYGSDDRWFNGNAGSTKTHSQIACTDTERVLFNASKFSRTVVSSVVGAGNFVVKQQRHEDVGILANKTVTLSFWARADGNKNIAVDLSQVFGDSGTPSAPVIGIGAQRVALTTSWQKKTITVTLPSMVGKTFGTDTRHYTELTFWFDAGSSWNLRSATLGQQSGTFDIAQIQLEEGSVATPFEQRPPGLELSLCQRYFEIVDVHWGWDGSLGGQATMAIWIGFSETKRIGPTISIITSSYLNLYQGGFSATTFGFKSEYSASNGGTIESRLVSAIYSASAEM